MNRCSITLIPSTSRHLVDIHYYLIFELDECTMMIDNIEKVIHKMPHNTSMLANLLDLKVPFHKSFVSLVLTQKPSCHLLFRLPYWCFNVSMQCYRRNFRWLFLLRIEGIEHKPEKLNTICMWRIVADQMAVQIS